MDYWVKIFLKNFEGDDEYDEDNCLGKWKKDPKGLKQRSYMLFSQVQNKIIW